MALYSWDSKRVRGMVGSQFSYTCMLHVDCKYREISLHMYSNNTHPIVGDEVEDLLVDVRSESGKVIFKAPEEGIDHYCFGHLAVTICTFIFM